MAARSEEVKDGISPRHSDEIQTASHRIHAALAPRIAVLSSSDVDEVLAPNNFDSFADLLKPFQESIENLTVRTSQLETRQCKTFPLSFDHIDLFGTSHTVSTSSLYTPADIVGTTTDTGRHDAQSPPKSKRRTSPYSRPEILLDAISARISSKSKALWESRAKVEVDQKTTSSHRRKPSVYSQDVALIMNENDLTSEGIDLPLYRDAEIDSITPWFADTRDMVLHARQVSEHETFGHPMAAILVVSASSSDPMNAFANLFEESQPHANSAFNKRPYVDPLIFRYYVLLHDVSKSGSDLTESIALLENVKKTYGLHCCLLPINSADGKSSNSAEDISSLWYRVLRNTSSYATSPPQDETNTSSPKIRQSLDALSKWHGGSTVEEEKVYASLINDDDVRKIKTFVRDFAAQSLIPFMERCVSLWNDQLAASRRGLTGRLLGAGRKFFGGASSRNSASSQPTQSFSTLGYYPHTALEAQTRRLADFAFMTHDYKLAASMYDLCRKDFANDKANKYIAGANEMFGLSHLMLMMGAPNALIDVDSYLAAAGTFYLVSPRQKGSSLRLEGLRATLLYYEAYRGLNFYRSAPAALVRTANEGSSEDENDLEVVAAMLLEQAALVNLRQSGKPALRKCALHLIMAAHRYRKCGQKHLSLRCFRASAQIYRMLSQGNISSLSEKGEEDQEKEEDGEKLADYIVKHERLQVREWEVINDHMEYEMAQQAFNDGNIAQALAHYVRILQRQSTSFEASSPESTSRHEIYLQGFMTCCKYLEGDLTTVLKAHGISPSLNIIESKFTNIEVNASTQSDDAPWRAIEERVLGQSVSKAYKEQNTTAINETFWLHICIRNPFNVQLPISSLAVGLVDAITGDAIPDGVVEVKPQDTFTLGPLETRIVSLAAICRSAHKLRLSQIRYVLGEDVQLHEDVVKVGRRLNDTKEQRTASSPIYAPSESIAVVIHESKAILEATFMNAASRLGLGEEVEATINFANVGKASLRKAQLYINRPDTLVDPNNVEIKSSQLEKGSFNVDNSLQAARSIAIPFPEDTLAAGDTFSWKVILRGSALGFVTLRALIVFESLNGERLTAQLQHTIQVDPVVDLSIQALPSRSEKMQYQLRLDASNLLQSDQLVEGDSQHIVIDALSVIAPCLMADTNQRKDVLEPFKSIGQQERRSTELFVTPESASKDGQMVTPISDLTFTVDQLRSILTGRGLDKSISTPPTHLTSSNIFEKDQANSQLSRFFFLARKEYRLSTLSRDFPSLLVRREGGDKRIDELQQIRQIFTLYEPNEVDIIAHWHIPSKSGETRHGQAFVFGLRLGPSIDFLAPLFSNPKSSEQEKAIRTMYAETEREKAAIWSNLRTSRLHIEDDPILFDFKLPKDQAKKHDFAQLGRKVVDVEFVVQNLSPLSTRKVILKLDNVSPPSGNAAAVTANTNATGKATSLIHASYVERLTISTTVAPLSKTTLQGKASIPRAGRAIFAPVLITNSGIVEEDGTQKKPFQRWEYCSQFVDIE
ncbi:hypothetical protein L7F22_019502 [Adiantum nelumboides]|nr:hypothetical protein [Adiantum nelumboides]